MQLAPQRSACMVVVDDCSVVAVTDKGVSGPKGIGMPELALCEHLQDQHLQDQTFQGLLQKREFLALGNHQGLAAIPGDAFATARLTREGTCTCTRPSR